MADRELDEVLSIARRASALVRAIYATPFTVEMKGPDDPVTAADREANALLCAAIERAFPGDAVLAEESVPASPLEVASLAARERVWFVDPLDGTREFAGRSGEFGVMIGLAACGVPALGVIAMPVTGRAIAARTGAGAFVEEAGGERRPLRVSPVGDPRDATLAISRSRRSGRVDAMIGALGIQRVVPCGSVGMKVARIVLGEADLYVHDGRPTKLWDTCAPEALLVAAGGRLTDLSGAAIDYAGGALSLENGLVATNGALHGAVLAALDPSSARGAGLYSR